MLELYSKSQLRRTHYWHFIKIIKNCKGDHSSSLLGRVYNCQREIPVVKEKKSVNILWRELQFDLTSKMWKVHVTARWESMKEYKKGWACVRINHSFIFSTPKPLCTVCELLSIVFPIGVVSLEPINYIISGCFQRSFKRNKCENRCHYKLNAN